HVLNVSDAASVIVAGEAGIVQVIDEPLSDQHRIPEARLLVILHTLHGMAAQPNAQVYVHCIAGQLRSPTILWLYLIACGIDADTARNWIETASPDAIPGTPRLVDPSMVPFVQKYGAKYFTPLPRGEILLPVRL
ncbi:MAG: hypothetical protein ACRCZF_13155, partial [Gemmataceae bacterium]